ncbi:MAG: hypothetical protein VX311_05475, partial [Planctomycetota bacterium]|nr:hypothetical protein [Planctomycetota bacterium]
QSTTMQTRMNAMRGRHPLFMLVLFLGFLFSHVWKTFRGRRDRYGTWIWNSASLDADQTRSS